MPMSVFSSLFIFVPVSDLTEGGKQKEPPLPGQLPLCCNDKFCMAFMFHRQISEDQKTQYAQNDGQCHQKAGYTVEEPEESPETYDGHRMVHTGDIPWEYSQPNMMAAVWPMQCPCPSAVPFAIFLIRFVFITSWFNQGTVFSGFRARMQYRLHRQGFGKIPEPRARMIFPRNRGRPDLAGGNGWPLILPLESDGFIIFPSRSRFGTRVSGRTRRRK